MFDIRYDVGNKQSKIEIEGGRRDEKVNEETLTSSSFKFTWRPGDEHSTSNILLNG